jgi:hypothetical protein
VNAAGPQMLLPYESELLCFLYDNKAPTDEFCQKAQIFYGHIKAKYGLARGRRDHDEAVSMQTTHIAKEKSQSTRRPQTAKQ